MPLILLTDERYKRVRDKWKEMSKAGLSWKGRYVINNVLRDIKRYVKKANIKPIDKFTIHTLRKCCGQNWADKLPMNVVKELMGHSHISTTATYYNKIDRDHEIKASKVIQATLEKGKSDVQVTYEAELNQIRLE